MRKRLAYSLLWVCSYWAATVAAQSGDLVYNNVDMPDAASFAAEPFLELDANRITTGYLMDAGLGFVNLRMYNGAAAQHDSLTVDGGSFEDIYATAFSLAMNSTSAQLFSTPTPTPTTPRSPLRPRTSWRSSSSTTASTPRL